MVLLFINLDRFDSLKGQLGRSRTDWLLQVVGQRFRETLRAEDTVARYGNDEFMVLLPHLEDPHHAALVATKLLASLEQPFLVGDQALAVTASIGIAAYPTDGESFETLVQNADAAMDRARQSTPNSYQFSASAVNDIRA